MKTLLSNHLKPCTMRENVYMGNWSSQPFPEHRRACIGFRGFNPMSIKVFRSLCIKVALSYDNQGLGVN